MTKDLVVLVLEDLWDHYRIYREQRVKPPTLDRIIGALRANSDLTYIEARKQLKQILSDGTFVRVKEKDNCGISWNVYCYVDSKHLQTCLGSQNRVVT